MSRDTEIQQHSVQKSNLAAIDPNYLKLRLDTQKLHQDILNFLSGTRTVVEYDKNSGTYYEETEKIGRPLANDEGIQAILSLVISLINPHTIQGNTDRKELQKILYHLEIGLAERLTLNYDKWGIDPEYRDHMIDTIMPMVHLILTRTIDNEERKGLSLGVEKLSKYITPSDNKARVI